MSLDLEKKGAIIGRVSPLHLGHRRLITKMVEECGYDNSLLLIGSCNTDQSMRHFFNYEQRRSFVKKVFPELKVVGLPDFPSDNEWILNLNDLLAGFGFDPKSVKFYTGNEEDIEVIVEDRRGFDILDRFDSELPIISAQQVRAALVHEKPKEEISSLVGDDLVDDIMKVFEDTWQMFVNK